MVKMKKFMLILLIGAATVFISYKYSARVYIYYLRIYYDKMYTQNELLIKSADLYDKKEYAELEDFLKPIILIYPDNNEFKKMAAYNYLQLGDSVRSAEIFAGIADGSIEENRTLEEILKKLYYSGNYGDLLYFYDKKIMLNNVNTAFYYGVSLFKKGRYDESYKSLIIARSNTFMLPELSYYIGLNLDKAGKPGESLAYIKSAFESDKANKDYKKALIENYRKLGLFKEAEILVRSR
jgi:hypothetical protein